MPDLVSMEMSEEDRKEYAGEVKSDPPKYPYGLELCLNDTSIGKVGASSLKVGDEVMVMAKARVSSTSAHEEADGGSDRSMRLQVTDMAIATPERSDADKAASLYPTQNQGSE